MISKTIFDSLTEVLSTSFGGMYEKKNLRYNHLYVERDCLFRPEESIENFFEISQASINPPNFCEPPLSREERIQLVRLHSSTIERIFHPERFGRRRSMGM